MKELLTAEELASILKVSKETIYQYVQQGIPTYSRKPLRFIAEDCLEWIRNRT